MIIHIHSKTTGAIHKKQLRNDTIRLNWKTSIFNFPPYGRQEFWGQHSPLRENCSKAWGPCWRNPCSCFPGSGGLPIILPRMCISDRFVPTGIDDLTGSLMPSQIYKGSIPMLDEFLGLIQAEFSKEHRTIF